MLELIQQKVMITVKKKKKETKNVIINGRLFHETFIILVDEFNSNIKLSCSDFIFLYILFIYLKIIFYFI
jgi:hypothetical protein